MPVKNNGSSPNSEKKKNKWGINIVLGFVVAGLLLPMFLSQPTVQNNQSHFVKNNHSLVKAGDFVPDNLKGTAEFFSFYCPHCFDFEYTYGIVDLVKKQEGEVRQYHVDFMGKSAPLLTKYWSIAIASNIQDKVKRAMFDMAREELRTGELIKEEALKSLFKEHGIEEYDEEQVKGLIAFQQRQVIMSVPSFFVDGNLIDYSKINAKSNEEFIEKLLKAIKGK